MKNQSGFEKLDQSIFQPIPLKELNNVRGGIDYTVVSTNCTSNSNGTTCTDERIDEDAQLN